MLPRSRCPSCDAPIRALDNIPLLSFLFLRGRCRGCGLTIPWRYPAIEATTAALFVLCFHHFGPGLEGLGAALFCSLMIVLAMIDVEHYILPNRITYPGIVVGLLLQPWLPWTTFRGALLGVALGAGVLLAMAGGWYLLRREQGMGMGDVKMLAMIGAFLGVQGVIVTLFVAALAGAVTGIALMMRGQVDMKSKLPFGAFLSLGALISLFAGGTMVQRYTLLL